ncbi:hypothetical protein V8C37DRAFT_395280 [Trichoderma ceciliae]
MRVKKFATGLDLDSFAYLCANAVQALYPGAHQALKDYLSKSMTDRYARTLFLNSRHKKLETRRELSSGLSTIPEAPSDEKQTNMPTAQPVRAIKNPDIPVLSRVHTSTPSQSDLSSVNTQQIRSRFRPPDEASTKFHRTSSIQVNQGKYPQPSATKEGSTIFTCQWCSELFNKKTLSESEWRRHIDRDLRTYVCLSEGCLEAHPVYPTFDEWFRHMELHDWRWHQKVYLTPSWVCTICDFNRDVYSNPQTLYLHLAESHASDFTNAELQAISRQSKIEQPRAWSDCLLCCFTIEEQEYEDEAMFPKRRKGQPKSETAKSARKNLEMTNPNPHGSDPDFPYTSSDSDDMESHQYRRQQRKDRSKAAARHIAVHLQVLMLLTIRFAALQNDDGELNDDIKSNSVDIDEGNSASEGTDLGRLSHVASEVDVTMKDAEDVDGVDNTEGAMDLDYGVVRDDIPVPDTDVDLEFVPRQHDGLPAQNDDFLNKIIESGAYQSWQDDQEHVSGPRQNDDDLVRPTPVPSPDFHPNKYVHKDDYAKDWMAVEMRYNSETINTPSEEPMSISRPPEDVVFRRKRDAEQPSPSGKSFSWSENLTKNFEIKTPEAEYPDETITKIPESSIRIRRRRVPKRRTIDLSTSSPRQPTEASGDVKEEPAFSAQPSKMVVIGPKGDTMQPQPNGKLDFRGESSTESFEAETAEDKSRTEMPNTIDRIG